MTGVKINSKELPISENDFPRPYLGKWKNIGLFKTGTQYGELRHETEEKAKVIAERSIMEAIAEKAGISCETGKVFLPEDHIFTIQVPARD